MITALQIIGGVMAWAVWGALGARAVRDRIYPKPDEDYSRKSTRRELQFFSFVAAPLVGTFCIARWALWRYSAEGKHEKRRRRLERQREVEQEYDRMLEDLE